MLCRTFALVAFVFALSCASPATAAVKHPFELKPPDEGWMGMAMAHTVEVMEQLSQAGAAQHYKDYKSKYLKW